MSSKRNKNAAAHRFKFYRAGGVDQVRLDSGEDLLRIGELDQKLWVALSCPVKGLELDAKTLQLLDIDHDGHLRAPELIAAAKWLREVLQDPELLMEGKDGATLSAIRDDTSEGRKLKLAAQHLLKGLKKETTAPITVADALRSAEIFIETQNAQPQADLLDPETQKLVADISTITGAVFGSAKFADELPAKVEQFMADCAAFNTWWQIAETDAANILPLGEKTLAAFEACEALRIKIDDYFLRCQLLGFDLRAQAGVGVPEATYLSMASKELMASAELGQFPLAAPAPDKALPLVLGVNPFWAKALGEFKTSCVDPLLGPKNELSYADWQKITSRLEAHKKWVAQKTGAAVGVLGIGRVREILKVDVNKFLQPVLAAVQAEAAVLADIGKVEKFVRLHRDFRRLLSNFVNFSDFYARRGAVFQAGTLYIDSRACELCVLVDNVAKHAPLATLSGTYLAYVECVREGCAPMNIAAVITAGDSDNLFVGRNAVFYDVQGLDWRATVTKIVDNPISIGQAFWSPYKKVIRWIEEQIAKRAAASDAAATDKLKDTASGVGVAATTGTASPPKSKIDIGVVAALGVAVGGITAALGALLNSLFGLGIWMPLGFLGAILLISGPSMLIAGLKLRRRNMGPILDANGWAVNVMTRINIPFGAALTTCATIPLGSKRSLVDPYAEKKPFWPRFFVALLFLGLLGFGLYASGLLSAWLPEGIGF